MSERVLVTGASGFVGGHLCRHLEEGGWRVRGAVRRADAAPNLEDRCVVGDIGPGTDWSVALQDVRYVIHCAAVAHRVGATGDDLLAECRRVNVEGTRQLAQAARDAGVRRLVFVSSVGAMASRADGVLTEASPCRPTEPYGVSKLEAEAALRATEGLSWTIVRPPLVYGPGNPGNMARLLRLVERGLPLPFGAIRNRRSFVYVGNLASALQRVLTHPGAAGQVYLVSDGADVSTAELVAALARARGRAARQLPVPPLVLRLLGRAGDAARRILGRPVGFDSYSVERLLGSLAVDSARIRRELDWLPPVGFDEGVARTVAA